jgi:hypothetical protein
MVRCLEKDLILIDRPWLPDFVLFHSRAAALPSLPDNAHSDANLAALSNCSWKCLGGGIDIIFVPAPLLDFVKASRGDVFHNTTIISGEGDLPTQL